MAKAIARYPGMPILGVLPAMAKDPLKLIRQMTLRYNDMVSAQMFNRQYVFVNDPNLVHKILVTNTNDFRKSDRSINLISRAFGKGLLGNQANDTHKTQRKLIQPAFHKQKIRGYADMMTDYSRTFVAQWQDGEIMDVSRAMNSLTMYIVAKALFGANMSDVEGDAYEAAQAIDVLQQETIRLTTSLWLWPKWMPTPSNRRLAKARSVIDRTLAKLIAQRRERGDLAEADGPNDFLAMLLVAEYDDGSKMEDGQIKDELATMFFAGHETTANSLTWTFYLLAQNPEARARLHQELDTVLQGRPATLDDLPSRPYTEMVVKESL
ncbi:cytochrome P450, partial [bacterium]|nr:cytochrome P450 [bacterium]